MGSRPFWLFIFILAVVVWFLRGNLTHFTYWGWLNFTFFTFLKCIDARATDGRSAYFAAVASIIVFGVLAMATLNQQGSLLQETVEENGLFLYFVGTYGIHYLPLVIILSTMEPIEFSLRNAALFCGSCGLFGLYLLHEDPSKIYGVDITSSIAAGGAVFFVFAAIAWLWSDKL